MRSSAARSSAARAVPRESERALFPVPRAHREISEESERSFPKAILAGLVGGFIGTMVMTEFQNAWNKASTALSRDAGSPASLHSGLLGWHEQGSSAGQDSREQPQSENATMKAAEKLAELAGKHLSYEQKKRLGPVVDYGFGTLQGAVYSAATELFGIRGGFAPALCFGAALFALADELAVPALGLSGRPSEYPFSAHLYGLASHLVYGLSTEVTRRGLRAAL